MAPKVFILGIALCSLAGCGGGSSSSSDPSVSTTSTTTNSSTPNSGIYSGKITFQDSSKQNSLLILSPNDRFIAVNSDGSYDTGSLTLKGSQYSVSTREWDGSQWQTGTLTGSVTSSTIKGTAKYNGATTSTVSFTKSDSLTNITASLKTISRTWSYTDSQTNYTTTITIQADGTVTGSKGDGCVFNGTITVPDPNVNVYDVSVTASNCPSETVGGVTYSSSDMNGKFTGLSFFVPASISGSSDKFTVVLDNTKVAQGGIFE